MSELSIFAYESSAVRTVTVEGEPWFVATDIAKILGYRDAGDILKMLDEDEAGTQNVRSRSENGVEQIREMSVISESGLYAAILKSRRPEAKAFRKWVTAEILPSIRKAGSYTVNQHSAPTFTTNNLSHGADLAVAADRTFRGFLRSARSAGLRLPQALRVANQQTIARTGMDMLGELGVVVEDRQAYADDMDNVQQFMDAWREGLTRYPFAPCVAGDLLAAYEQWCAQTGEEAQPYVYFNRRAFSLPWLTRIQTHIDGKNLRIVMSREFIKPPHELKLHWYSRSVAAFRAAME